MPLVGLVKNNVQLASVLVVLVMGRILVTHVIQGLYSGSILSGNISKKILGMELAAFAAILAVVMAIGGSDI